MHSTNPEIDDLHAEIGARDALLDLNNANARETSLLSRDRFDQLIGAARIATFVRPGAALLLAFEQDDDYDGGHFLWFRRRFPRFIYIDRVLVAHDHRRRGLGRMLYADLFARAHALAHTAVVCEVNRVPPNPVSDHFHAAHGFVEVGTATFDDGAKTVRYLLRRSEG
jgi:predicted GNAT superfamily acetyltransferase